jgi:hypothetical protein
MTEVKLPIPANDHSASTTIAQEQTSAKGGVFSVILWLGKYPLQAMGIVEAPFNPEELYRAVNQERRRVIQALERSQQWDDLEAQNDDVAPSSDQEQAA